MSNGTDVLGLSNIGPKAAMPVIEGKALLLRIKSYTEKKGQKGFSKNAVIF